MAGSDTSPSLLHLRQQELQLQHATERATLQKSEPPVRSSLELEETKLRGVLIADHFPSPCRRCGERIAHSTNSSEYVKWYCALCGKGDDGPSYACAKEPVPCKYSLCTCCLLQRFSLAPPTPEQAPFLSEREEKSDPKPVFSLLPASDPPAALPTTRHGARKRRMRVKRNKPQLRQHSRVSIIRMNSAVNSTIADKICALVDEETSCRLWIHSVGRECWTSVEAFWEVLRDCPRQHTPICWQASLTDIRKIVASRDTGQHPKPQMRAPRSNLAEMKAFSEKLQKWYDEKPGDIVTEMLDNLRFPSKRDSLNLLGTLSRALSSEDILGSLGKVSLVELLVLRQYTQRPIDLDRDLLWSAVPVGASAAEKQKYESTHTNWNWQTSLNGRNGSIIASVVAAIQDQAPGGRQEVWSEYMLRKWIKWFWTAAAVSAQPNKTSEEGSLTKVLQLSNVTPTTLETCLGLCKGDHVTWPELTSVHRVVSATFPNSLTRAEFPNTITFWLTGIKAGRDLQALSQYPSEDEYILSPFTILQVTNIIETDSGGLEIHVHVISSGVTPEFYSQVRRDGLVASRRLRAAVVQDEHTGLKTADKTELQAVNETLNAHSEVWLALEHENECLRKELAEGKEVYRNERLSVLAGFLSHFESTGSRLSCSQEPEFGFLRSQAGKTMHQATALLHQVTDTPSFLRVLEDVARKHCDHQKSADLHLAAISDQTDTCIAQEKTDQVTQASSVSHSSPCQPVESTFDRFSFSPGCLSSTYREMSPAAASTRRATFASLGASNCKAASAFADLESELTNLLLQTNGSKLVPYFTSFNSLGH
ncbi:hypothetical protein DIPPA_65533 [Diplonema papillatum]|nr:hypothetical protein DIPPA_65533 [Diplonema papillatum]